MSRKSILIFTIYIATLIVSGTGVSATLVFEEDFESGAIAWAPDNGVWEIGTPTAGPASCHGGSKCAGTVLGGDYPADTDSRLISPSIVLSDVIGAEEIHLRFWHWFSYHADYSNDAGYVQISVYDTGTSTWLGWQTIGNSISSISPVWSLNQVDLTAYAGETVKIAFYHTAGSPWDDTGWYIDDIQIITEQYIFDDVSQYHWAKLYIEALYNAGITSGCSTIPLLYCPDDNVTRTQMAVFLLRGIYGSGFNPAPATGTIFNDVAIDHPAAAWIEDFYFEGITSGCSVSPPLYCPDNPVTRAQMAVFLLRAIYGAQYVPPAASGTVFDDVPMLYWAADWIEDLMVESVTSGCSLAPPLYCPGDAVTRAQMAVFLVRTFNLPLNY